MSAKDIIIASAKRTAVGSFNGAFANTPAHDLGAAAITAALAPLTGNRPVDVAIADIDDPPPFAPDWGHADGPAHR